MISSRATPGFSGTVDHLDQDYQSFGEAVVANSDNSGI
jgi:hypothetical protein